MSPHENLIPGYRVTRLLGRGGFGEVWEAVAPGGVAKAVKFVFDDRSTQRSEQELRALNRVKNVRHPFVLSVERIEHCESGLAIVTELGERNLKERFAECRRNGEAGIARGELLRLLHDAAEALDFIYVEHALQHLDVKPENMLLFGQHLKIADFGLVKNIYDRSASVVNAMTPVYSAPELIEGRPTRTTDQYALAIVYQEMLTGKLPFNGLTTAQLAAQHLRDVPDLSSVPESQRPIVARALSKEPTQRYESCTAFIDELKAAQGTGAPMKGREKSLSQVKPLKSENVEFGSDERSDGGTLQLPISNIPERSAGGAGQAMDTVTGTPGHTAAVAGPDQQKPGLRPVIVMGIGGTGARVLQGLRQRLKERNGDLHDAPAFRLLLIDSDSEDLNRTNQDRESWTEITTVPIPLLGSVEYRTKAKDFRGWLSRKWLFNVPRDLRTHGMRPLGRLALLSHPQRMREAMRDIPAMATEESRERSGRSLGLTFGSGAPHAFVVGSIAGGTASGTMLDVAYAVRHRLKSSGFGDATVDGVLVHAVPSGRDAQRAVACSYAFLHEQANFSRLGSFFPGNKTLDIPPFHGDNRTFRRTFVFNVGETSDEGGWAYDADDVAEFIYEAMTSEQSGGVGGRPSGTFGHAAALGKPTGAGQGEEAVAQIMAVDQLAPPTGSFVCNAAWQLCLDIVDSLRGTYHADSKESGSNSAEATVVIQALAETQAERVKQEEAATTAGLDAAGLRVKTLIDKARAVTTSHLGCSATEYVERLVTDGLKKLRESEGSEQTTIEPLVQAIEELFGVDDPDGRATDVSHRLFETVYECLAGETQRASEQITEQIRTLVDRFSHGVSGALVAVESTTKRVREMQRDVKRRATAGDDRIVELQLSLKERRVPAESSSSFLAWRGRQVRRDERQTQEQIREFASLMLERLMISLVYRQLRIIEVKQSALTDRLQRLWQDLKRLQRLYAQQNGESSTTAKDGRSLDTLEQYLCGRFRAEREALVEQAYTRIGEKVFEGPRKLQRFLDGRSDLCTDLARPLFAQCRAVLLQWVAGVTERLIEQSTHATDEDGFGIDAVVAETLAARSAVRDGCRTTVHVPEHCDAALFGERLRRHGHDVSVVTSKVSGVAVVTERGPVTLMALAAQLAAGTDSPDLVHQLAQTLHAREDVEWNAADGYDGASCVVPVSESEGHSEKPFGGTEVLR